MKKPLTLFVLYTGTKRRGEAAPICKGLSMSTGTVGESLHPDEVMEAAEEAHREDLTLLEDLCDAHLQKEIIATCYDRETYLNLIDVLTPMLIDDRFDDERRFKLVHASTLRQVAHDVIVGKDEVDSGDDLDQEWQ